jgi:hypothetical protein
MTEIEDLRAEVEKYRKEEAEREKRNYVLDKLGAFMFLIAGNIIFFGAISLMRYIVTSWWDAGILGDDPTYYLLVMGVYLVLLFQGAYRFAVNLMELFKEEFVFFCNWLSRFIKETREARELYLKAKEENHAEE